MSTDSSEQLRRLRAAVLDLLPAPGQEPVSTSDLRTALHLSAYEHSTQLWPILNELANDGVAERIARPGQTMRYWRCTPAPAPDAAGQPSGQPQEPR
ncbi:hypothetical protein [Dactylosporangium salmoneum]|uniref:Uncharacterized protein n=1 Tax=Dactylosporangium salmoneum TaxID=53361 RepID=A0ABN3GHX3_9ACTN